MASIRYWAWLSSVTAASPQGRYALAAHYGDAEQAFLAPAGDFAHVPGLSARDAALFEKRELRDADRILEACLRERINMVALSDAAYPRRLRNICAPPVVLYVKGTLPDVDAVPSVAVLGTRSATPYGLRMARKIAFEIARCGGTVISGLTEGIDRMAAEGCLLGGGRCIGVLGTAHGKDGPLREDIALSGALVSEYPPGTRPQNYFFRERNRVAAGLSHAVCVVEAPAMSGSLLFAREALEQGREIFAVPGNADAANSAGIVTLLKQGARPAACGWDVLEELAAVYPGTLHPPGEVVELPERGTPAPEKPAKTRPSSAKSDKESRPSAKKEIDKQSGDSYIDLTELCASLSEEQKSIVTVLGRGDADIDDIIEATGLGTAKVLSQLTLLEIRGVICRAGGRRVGLKTKK